MVLYDVNHKIKLLPLASRRVDFPNGVNSTSRQYAW